MYKLTVKGDRFQALACALKRTIPTFFERAKPGKDDTDAETTLLALTDDEQKIVTWFSEKPLATVPFEDGTLLFYSKVERVRIFLSPSASLQDFDIVVGYLRGIGAEPSMTRASGGCYSVTCKLVEELSKWEATGLGTFCVKTIHGNFGIM